MAACKGLTYLLLPLECIGAAICGSLMAACAAGYLVARRLPQLLVRCVLLLTPTGGNPHPMSYTYQPPPAGQSPDAALALQKANKAIIVSLADNSQRSSVSAGTQQGSLPGTQQQQQHDEHHPLAPAGSTSAAGAGAAAPPSNACMRPDFMYLPFKEQLRLMRAAALQQTAAGEGFQRASCRTSGSVELQGPVCVPLRYDVKLGGPVVVAHGIPQVSPAHCQPQQPGQACTKAAMSSRTPGSKGTGGSLSAQPGTCSGHDIAAGIQHTTVAASAAKQSGRRGGSCGSAVQCWVPAAVGVLVLPLPLVLSVLLAAIVGLVAGLVLGIIGACGSEPPLSEEQGHSDWPKARRLDRQHYGYRSGLAHVWRALIDLDTELAVFVSGNPTYVSSIPGWDQRHTAHRRWQHGDVEDTPSAGPSSTAGSQTELLA